MKTANSSISTTPTLKFDDAPARNAFEYLQMIYIARNQSLTYNFAADSMGLRSLVVT